MLRGFSTIPCKFQDGKTISFLKIPTKKIWLQNYKSSGSPVEHILPHFASVTASLDTYSYLIHRYEGSCGLHDIKFLHLQFIRHGFGEDVFLFNTLVNGYAKLGYLDSARKLFDEMPEKNVVSWTCLISGYVQRRMLDEAFTLFHSMLHDGCIPTQYTFGSMLRACQESGLAMLKFGMQIHAMISKTRYSLDTVVAHALILMYGSCHSDSNSLDNASRIFYHMPMRNLISWNSIVSVYSQRGDVRSCFSLFMKMQLENFGLSLRPNEYTFGSLLSVLNSQNCLNRFSVCLYEQTFSWITKTGFNHNLFVGSALVSGFSRFGYLDHAKTIFKHMTERNAVSLNGLMVGLVKQKQGEEAFEIFRESQDLVQLNSDSYVVLLSAIAEFRSSEESMKKGKEIHAFLIRNGMNDHKISIGNGLINIYAKCGAIDNANTVFMSMDIKDSVSWNTMMSGLDQNGYWVEVLTSFIDMKRSGLMPSNFTLISTLSSCASLGWNKLGKMVHSECIKLGLDLNTSVSNSLLSFYSDCSLLDCQKVFDLMAEHDQVSWNTMIGAVSDSEESISSATNLFVGMMKDGWIPNRVTFMNVFSSLSSVPVLELSRQFHSLAIKCSVLLDGAVVENALISTYGKCGDIEDCEKLFSRMSGRRDEVSWNSMISAYINNNHLPKVMDIIWFMTQNEQKMDCYTFATLLSACASVASLERGMEIHSCAIRSCYTSDVVVNSALIDMYSKCGRIDYSSRVFEKMLFRNKFSWNSMISGYARHGHGKKALEIFEEMMRKHQKPDHVTYVGVLSACSHAGLVDEGIKFFESMRNYCVIPRIEHYSCMVDLLGRAGELKKIEEFLRKMPIEPNALVWRTVIGACYRANTRHLELEKQAVNMLVQLEPRNPVNYVLISNMYASRKSWQDVAECRTRMRRGLVKKEAGCSWVTMKDGVHVFVASDRSHPETDKIYAELQMLHKKIMEAGYVPQVKFALYDVDLENKEELLRYHSEKLAVAFVLTRTSGLPIRIMKNLRVCGDCHSALEYISMIVFREIILRDSNRFHHFKDGKCSCGDYW